ncbi:unnamed protein product [Phaeothamnion confervicola]
MANLIVRNIDDAVVKALKQRAALRGVSAEAEHRRILEQALLRPEKLPLAEILRQIPFVGQDSDLERPQDDSSRDVFD